MLKVVLDTNIILAAISKSSRYHIIVDFLFNNSYRIVVSNDILLEYEEKLVEKFGFIVSDSFITGLLQSGSVERTDTFFNLHLIKADPDDNKFVDAAFCANANYIVTNAKHFNVLKAADFPSFAVININEFARLLTQPVS
jgi:uncharacterized protein